MLFCFFMPTPSFLRCTYRLRLPSGILPGIHSFPRLRGTPARSSAEYTVRSACKRCIHTARAWEDLPWHHAFHKTGGTFSWIPDKAFSLQYQGWLCILSCLLQRPEANLYEIARSQNHSSCAAPYTCVTFNGKWNEYRCHIQKARTRKQWNYQTGLSTRHGKVERAGTGTDEKNPFNRLKKGDKKGTKRGQKGTKRGFFMYFPFRQKTSKSAWSPWFYWVFPSYGN